MNNKLRHIGEQHLRYNTNKWRNKGAFDILMKSVMFYFGAVNGTPRKCVHDISISGY